MQDYNIDFKEVLDHLYDGIYIADGKGKTLYINQAYTRITGIKPEEVINRSVEDIVKEGKLYKNPVTMEVIKSKKQVNSVGRSLKNGKKLLVTGIPIFDDNGEVKRVVINDRQMSDLIRISEELEASRKKLKAVEEVIKKDMQEIRHLRSIQIGKEVMIGISSQMNKVKRMIQQVAPTDATVLITGETGVGKELVAHEIYSKSKRCEESYIKINCAAIPSNLLESELFGYEKGSFTGAKTEGKAGMFELANKGTLLLDEIGDMPLELQAKLLRVLQQQEITRIGGTKPIKINVRILASTNKNLEKQVKQGKFRKDLYYRLNVFPIYIPPLKERTEDIEILAKHFISNFNKKYRKKVTITNDGIKILKQYSWPGNIRELENIMERMVIITENSNVINEEVLSNALNIDFLQSFDQLNNQMGLKEIVRNVEKKIIKRVLSECKSTREAAKILKIDQSTVVKKAKKLGIKINR